MPSWSRYAGRLIDVSSRHSIRVVNGDGLPNLNDPTVVLDFFYHDERYWRATIPLAGIDQIYGQAFNFSRPRTRRTKTGTEIRRDRNGLPKRTIPMLFHLQCRFKFRDDAPISLVPMGGITDSVTPQTIHDIVYSLEASGPFGVGFNLRDGFGGNLISTHRFLSTEAMVFERLVLQKQYVTESAALPLNEMQKRQLLVSAMLRSNAAGMSEQYFLYRPFRTNNCTSNPFEMLDNVVDYGLQARIGAMLYRLPLSPRFYLRVRGMDSDSSYRKLVRSEFESYIEDPETRKRKLDYLRRRRERLRAAGDDRAIMGGKTADA